MEVRHHIPPGRLLRRNAPRGRLRRLAGDKVPSGSAGVNLVENSWSHNRLVRLVHGAAHRVLVLRASPQGVAGGGAAAGGQRVRGGVQPAEVLEGGAAPPADQLRVLVRPCSQAGQAARSSPLFTLHTRSRFATWKWL
jgi:hypothetical protein